MKIAVRCIYRLAVTPNFLIVDLKEEELSKFLSGNKQERINIIRPYIKKPGPSDIAEIAWIPLFGMKDSELMELELECKKLMRGNYEGNPDTSEPAGL